MVEADAKDPRHWEMAILANYLWQIQETFDFWCGVACGLLWLYLVLRKESPPKR